MEYFTPPRSEEEMDKRFNEELKTCPLALAREAHMFFQDTDSVKLGRAQTRRLAALIGHLTRLAGGP